MLVAGVAGFIVAGAAASPFCSNCRTWKKDRSLGSVNVPREAALEAITSGEIVALVRQGVGPGPGRMTLNAAFCPNCTSSADVDISFHETTVDDKGGKHSAQIIQVTYPGEMLDVLAAILKADSQGQPPKTDMPSAADPLPKRAAAPRDRITLRPAERKLRNEIWALEIHEDAAILVNSEDQVVARIPLGQGQGRLVFPSFWDSVRNLGILTDEGNVVWFKPDKAAIKEIKKNLDN